MLRILSFVKNPEILPVLDRVVNKHEGWTGLRAASLDEAQAIVQDQAIDVVLLGAGTGVTERQALTETITRNNQQTILIDHYGGGSGLLYAEVMNGLA